MIFEGVKEKYFHRVAHLSGPSGSNVFNGCFLGKTYKGIVEIGREKSREEFEGKFRKKTPTWTMAREKIERLIKDIEKEKGKEVPFNICGNKSIFSKPAEVIEIYDPLLAEIKKQDQDLFLCLFDSAKNGGECTGMSREAFKAAISNVQAVINYPHQINYLQLIELCSHGTKKVKKYQDNCFTWCRTNLEKIDITLCDNQLEKFISITTLYVTYKPQERVPEGQILSLTNGNINREDQRENLYERFVTYRINRDKRTEDWKLVEKKININKKNHFLTMVGKSAGVIGITVGPIALMSNPITAIATLIGSIAIFSASVIADKKVEKNQIELLNHVESNQNFQQVGNNLNIAHSFRKNRYWEFNLN